MNQELYYVVTPEFEDIDEGVSELTGNKDIDLYEILNNKPNRIKSLNVDSDENPEEAISEYIWQVAPELFDEAGKVKNFTLIQL